MPRIPMSVPANVWNMQQSGYLNRNLGFWTYGVKVPPDSTLLFLAGCVPLDSKGRLVGKNNMRAQIKQCMENIRAVLAAEGATLGDIVNRRIFVTSIPKYFKAVKGWASKEYPEFWDSDPSAQTAPSGTLLEINRLGGKDFMIEIEVFACVNATKSSA